MTRPAIVTVISPKGIRTAEIQRDARYDHGDMKQLDAEILDGATLITDEVIVAEREVGAVQAACGAVWKPKRRTT